MAAHFDESGSQRVRVTGQFGSLEIGFALAGSRQRELQHADCDRGDDEDH